MKPCMCAGAPCGRTAVLLARIAGVGDRVMSRECFDIYVSLGMDLRVLDPNAPLPQWRRRSLAKDFSRATGAA